MRAVLICVSLLAVLVASSVSAADVESRIVSIIIDPTALVSGGPVSVTVETTPDIVSVDAAVGPHHVTIPAVESGMYYGSATIPRFPRFIRGIFRVRFTGKTADGEAVAADTTIRLN